MSLKIVGRDEDPDPTVASLLAPDEIHELDKLSADPAIVGLAVMTREGSVLRSEGVWSDSAPAVFSNLLRVAFKIGEEFGESSRNIVAFAENNDFEIAVLPLSQADVVLTRRRAAPGGLNSVR